METAQSFSARRSATSNLPTFQLPPPDLSSMHKYPSFAPSGPNQVTPTSAVLTPPAAVEGLSPLSSSVNSGSSQSSTSGIAPYSNPSLNNLWQQNSSSYTYSNPTQVPSSLTQQYVGRPLYSPSINLQNRNSNSPAGNDALPQPPYELNLPPFPTSMSVSGGPNGQGQLPQISHQQHQVPNTLMSSSQAPPQSGVHAPEPYGGRAPPTPGGYYPSSGPQHPSYSAYAHQSPTQQSPVSTSAPQSRISPVSHQPPQSGYRPAYQGYPLPAMSGPIMSNVHSPGGQMALIGGNMMQTYAAQHMGQHMYGHPGQQPPQNERPFKCDQCPQSFNRNHDLKRHKRIHLAVKPFPCDYCDKSFSRKDALKRHILVKGCGKSKKSDTPNPGSDSPLEKSDSEGQTSPDVTKKEI